MNNFKLNFTMIAHEEPRTFAIREKDENGKEIRDGKKIGERTTIATLFVRNFDADLGEKLNADKTYPYCHTVVLRLTPELFSKIKPFENLTFICDSYAAGRYDERIMPRKVKIGGEYISLRSDDVDETKTSSLEAL